MKTFPFHFKVWLKWVNNTYKTRWIWIQISNTDWIGVYIHSIINPPDVLVDFLPLQTVQRMAVEMQFPHGRKPPHDLRVVFDPASSIGGGDSGRRFIHEGLQTAVEAILKRRNKRVSKYMSLIISIFCIKNTILIFSTDYN